MATTHNMTTRLLDEDYGRLLEIRAALEAIEGERKGRKRAGARKQRYSLNDTLRLLIRHTPVDDLVKSVRRASKSP